MNHNFFWFFFLSVVVLLSCTKEPECTQEVPHDLFVVTFYDKDDLVEKEVDFDFILTADTVFIHPGEDSLETISEIELALNPNDSMSIFYFVTGVKTDSVAFVYSRELQWLSAECGPNFSYQNLDVYSHSFDSVSVENSFIDAQIDENIRLYN